MLIRRIFVFLIFLTAGVAHAANLPGPLVDAKWLKDNLSSVAVLDVRKDTKSFTAKPVYKRDKKTKKLKLVKVGSHIPGAALINYKKVRAKRKINGETVTRMIPEKTAFEKLVQNAGVNKDSAIVIVSKGTGHGDMTIATRLYWQLKYFGHTNMAILDGGMAAWLNAGGKFTNKPATIKKGNWIAKAENKSIYATSEDVANAVKDANIQLIDARPISQYLGTYSKSYVYNKGHIPTAKSVPTELLSYPKAPSTFTKTDDLKKLVNTLGLDADKPTITYCNSGHLATGQWFVMSELLGNKNTRVYDGSMHQWTLEKRPTVLMKME